MAQKTRARSRQEFMSKLNEPYELSNYPNPNQVYTEPKKAGMPEVKRSEQVSSRKDGDKDFHIGIKDIDESVMYYFKEVLKLTVVQNGSAILVPVIYGNQENWKSVQLDGYYRDKEGKLMAPLIMFKRDSVAQNRTLGNKLDGNHVTNLQYFQKKYSKKNFYSNFNVLTNRSPEKEYKVSVTPDYVTVTYTCSMWTQYMEQMDNLIEAVNFSSRSYWGDPNRFQFFTSIETFNDATEYNQGDNRFVRTNFNITINAYLIPDTINKKIANSNKVFGLSKLVFGLEASDSPIDKVTVSKSSKGGKPLGSIIAADSTNTNITNNVSTATSILSYVNANVTKKATSIPAPHIARFTGSTILQPPDGSGLPNTTIYNFTVFINGQYVPSSEITIVDNGTYIDFIFNINEATGGLGYRLETNDEVIAVGKWN
jgi:hypothetical protein